MRDDLFLRNRLEYIWNTGFNDIEKKNKIYIMFKGNWKNKFGHIKMLHNGSSEIVVNGYFKNPKVPEWIIDLTIAHELVNYSNGFNSPLPKLFKHPHQGGIVDKDLKKRGFNELIKMEKNWIEKEWKIIAREEFKQRARRSKKVGRFN